MYLQKVMRRKTCKKSGSSSTPKYHGSGTLQTSYIPNQA